MLLFALHALAGPEIGVAAGYRAQAWLQSVGDFNSQSAEITGWVRFPHGVEVGVGIRRLFSPKIQPATAFDGYVDARIGPRVGIWAPTAGVEVGVTGALQPNWEEVQLTFFYEELVENATRDVVYGAFTVAPARFRFGHVDLQAGALSFGSSLPHWSRAVRVELLLLEAGWVF